MKIIGDRHLTLVVTLDKPDDGEITVQCRAIYEVSSEDLKVTREIEPTLTQAQITGIKQLALNVVTQIQVAEGV